MMISDLQRKRGRGGYPLVFDGDFEEKKYCTRKLKK
jgi:hypothetical protein